MFRLLVTNPGGTVAGPSSKPIKTLPRMPPAPREEIAARTDTQVKLRWDAFGHEITKLALQYAILKGKDTFTDLKKNGGRQITLSNPQETGEYVVKNLKPETNYVFRLVASNSSGQSTGEMLGPIKTVSFSPEMMDKSGWLYLVSTGAGKAKRRGSIRNKGPPKYDDLRALSRPLYAYQNTSSGTGLLWTPNCCLGMRGLMRKSSDTSTLAR